MSRGNRDRIGRIDIFATNSPRYRLNIDFPIFFSFTFVLLTLEKLDFNLGTRCNFSSSIYVFSRGVNYINYLANGNKFSFLFN